MQAMASMAALRPAILAGVRVSQHLYDQRMLPVITLGRIAAAPRNSLRKIQLVRAHSSRLLPELPELPELEPPKLAALKHSSSTVCCWRLLIAAALSVAIRFDIKKGQCVTHQSCSVSPQGSHGVHCSLPTRSMLSLPNIKDETHGACSLASGTITTLPANRVCSEVNA
jgi:hypothetical protein